MVRAKFNFQQTNEDELSFARGDVIHVTRVEEGGWWEGTLDGRTGWFPSNYVREVKPSGRRPAGGALGLEVKPSGRRPAGGALGLEVKPSGRRPAGGALGLDGPFLSGSFCPEVARGRGPRGHRRASSSVHVSRFWRSLPLLPSVLEEERFISVAPLP